MGINEPPKALKAFIELARKKVGLRLVDCSGDTCRIGSDGLNQLIGLGECLF